MRLLGGAFFYATSHFWRYNYDMDTTSDKPLTTERVRIVVRAEGEGPPTAVRLRRALKWLLRTHGLRCEAIELAEEDDTKDDDIDASMDKDRMTQA